ncbi:MAG: hypothetical protein ACFFED_11870 [Candidatus Thorarchaeota archaeon]
MKYEVYKAYDPDASSETNPSGRIDVVFADTHNMLEFVQMVRPDIIVGFVEAIELRLEGEAEAPHADEGNRDFTEYMEKYPTIDQFPSLYRLIFGFVYANLGLAVSQDAKDATVTVPRVKNVGCVSVPRYHRIKAMIDVLGREDGIQLYKDFVLYRSQLPVEEKIKGTVKSFREESIKNWSEAKHMDFAVYVFDENMHVCKFTNCVSYDALKHLDDPEVGYLTQCYPTTFLVDRLYETLGQRRSVTLFNHHFCDELYWDKNVHPDPEHPSLDFMDKIVIE